MVQSADQVTGALADWLRSRFAEAGLTLTDEPAAGAGPVIRLRLLGLAIESLSSRLAPATVLRLDYLITVEAEDVLAVHRLIGEIAFAIADNPVLPVAGAAPVVLRLEQREAAPLGLAVSTQLQRPLARPEAPPVLRAPVVRVGGLGMIGGIVRGPDGRPVAGALVEIAALRRSQVTGTDGAFRFDAPADTAGTIEVTARKHGISTTGTAEAGRILTLELTAES